MGVAGGGAGGAVAVGVFGSGVGDGVGAAEVGVGLVAGVDVLVWGEWLVAAWAGEWCAVGVGLVDGGEPVVADGAPVVAVAWSCHFAGLLVFLRARSVVGRLAWVGPGAERGVGGVVRGQAHGVCAAAALVVDWFGRVVGRCRE